MPIKRSKRPAKRLGKTIKSDSWMDKLAGTLPRIKKPKLRRVGISEASIQQQVEAFLQIKGLKYFHVPDAIYQLCSPHSRTPIHVKKIISESLKGVPDLIIFKTKSYLIGDDKLKTDDKDMDCLMIELKKKNGKARQSQTKWHGELPVQVIDNVDDAIELIKNWSES